MTIYFSVGFRCSTARPPGAGGPVPHIGQAHRRDHPALRGAARQGLLLPHLEG